VRLQVPCKQFTTKGTKKKTIYPQIAQIRSSILGLPIINPSGIDSDLP